jgi:UDP-glucuronate decarboxylase
MRVTGARILVTGAAGFLGSHLCDALVEAGHSVVGLDNFHTGRRQNIAHLLPRPAFELIAHDVREPYFGQFDIVYHLACPASPPAYQADPISTSTTCVLGSLNMLQSAERARARFILASTSEVYGDPLEHPQRESYRGNTNPIGPRSCYDEGKRMAESLTFDFSRSRGLDIKVVRIFNTYGPRMNPGDGRVVTNVIVQALDGRDITIYGDGRQTRSFCYVDDLIHGLVALLDVDRDFSGPVNLGNPQESTMLELAEMVRDLTGSSSAIVHRPLPIDDPRQRRPDIALASRILGWAPAVPLREGLARTIASIASERGNGGPRSQKST